MNQTPSCPKCGAPLPADAPAGLCPKCLVQAGFESENQSQPEPERTAASPNSSGFTPPEVEELAKRFPLLEILELLGKGGMGAVYKARQPGLDRLVAIKILPVETSHDPTFAERFTREARALARLSHPNIVAIYDFGQTEGLYFFVMEYVDGVNLRQAIQAGGMTSQNTLAIVPQICDALQFAHDEGIVHRDIKPENILIDKRGRVKIADFGLAKLLGLEQPDHALTHTRQVMGTLRYMAPEQMEGSHEVDHRADIYSLGVVFYELLTGELPIGRFAPPSKKVQIDVRLDEVVLRALEKEPEQRYQHASELKTSVDHITATPNGAAGRAPPSRMTDLAPTAPDARLSKSALFGAIWASYFFAALVVAIPVFLLYNLHSFSDTKAMPRSMMAKPAGTMQIAAAGGTSAFQGLIAQVPGPSTASELFRLLLMFAAAVAGLVAIAAPFGTTIFGFVAIGQIRRSAGNLYGLPLAVFDALLFPLLLLDGLILVAVGAVTTAALVMTFQILGHDPNPLLDVLAEGLGLGIGLPIIALVDYRIVRGVWRNVTGFEPPPQAQPQEVPANGLSNSFAYRLVTIAISLLGTALLFLPWIQWRAAFSHLAIDTRFLFDDGTLDFRSGIWAQQLAHGYNLWEGILICGMFFSVGCIGIATLYSSRRDAWRHSLLLVVGLAVVVLAVHAIIQEPQPLPSPSIQWAKEPPALYAEDQQERGTRSDVEFLRAKLREGYVKFEARHEPGPYAALVLAGCFLILGMVELLHSRPVVPATLPGRGVFVESRGDGPKPG